MYNPVDMLVNKTSSRDQIKTTANVAIEGVNAIADILYRADLSGMDKHSLSGLGSALLVLNGVIAASIEKMESATNE